MNPDDARGAWRAGLLLCRLLQRLAPYNEQWPWIAAALRHAFAANRAERAQAVVSTFPPLAGHIAGLLFHWRFGVPWIADFRDPLAGSAFRNRPWAGPYDRMLEEAVFRHAAAVIVTNDAVAERFRQRHPQHAGKIDVLWNGFDPGESAVRPVPAAAPRRLVHAGSLYGPRKPDPLLRALDRLLGAGRLARGAWRVEFIGPHDEGTFAGCAQELERLASAGVVEIRRGLRPRRELEEAMAAASVLLLLDLTGEERSAQVPAKLFEYVRTGLPVVAWSPPGSPTRSVLKRAGIASLVFGPGDDEDAVAAQLAAWLENPPPLSSPSEWFLENFDGARQAEWLARLIRAVAAGESRGSAAGLDAASSD